MQGSPTQFDVVQPFAYDQYGREKFKYLPYATTETNGFYKQNPLGTTSYTGSPHHLYYTNGAGDKVQDDGDRTAKPFSCRVHSIKCWSKGHQASRGNVMLRIPTHPRTERSSLLKK